MNTQQPRLIAALIMLHALLALPADAYHHERVEPVIEANSMDFLPLEVGNRWTYEHFYHNYSYGNHFNWAEPGNPVRAVLLAKYEIPGYPYFDEGEDWRIPPDDLTGAYRELTIEITHTERIEGREYFVFSEVDYDWPPVPNLFLAGQKVRFSDEADGPSPPPNILLFRWNGQDIPIYAFPQHYIRSYSIPEYPPLQNQSDPVKLAIRRDLWHVDDMGWLQIPLSKPPASLSQEIVARFGVFHPLLQPTKEQGRELALGDLWFITGYGFVAYRIRELGHVTISFSHLILPVSAVIAGKEIEYSLDFPEHTQVQPTSWGQLKAHHGRGQ